MPYSIADENTADDVLSAMRSGGVDVESANGALVIISRRRPTEHGYFDLMK